MLMKRSPNVASWHIADVRVAAPEGLLTSGLPTLEDISCQRLIERSYVKPQRQS